MAFFDQVYKKLFSKKSGQPTTIHEVIDRSDAYKNAYQRWKLSKDRTDFLKKVSNSYQLKEQGLEGEPNVHLLRSKYSNGFAISYDQTLNKIEFQFAFDWFAEKLEELTYMRKASDVRISEKENYVETKEKHYLKPKLTNIAPIDQQYGNVLIEHILINDQPSYLKLVANVYSDRMYKDPEKFEILAEYLLGNH